MCSIEKREGDADGKCETVCDAKQEEACQELHEAINCMNERQGRLSKAKFSYLLVELISDEFALLSPSLSPPPTPPPPPDAILFKGDFLAWSVGQLHVALAAPNEPKR